MNRRHFLHALSSTTALLLVGCATPQRVTHVERVETRISLPPPAPLAEAIPVSPYTDAYWIAGHWKWNGSRYVWAYGRWEQPRPSMVYQQAYWTNSSGNWKYHPGRWVSIASPAADYTPTIVTVPPPTPQVEVITAPPRQNQVWISGYWRWRNGRHAWVPGHWQNARAGYFWAPGHWVQRGSGWIFAGGFWQRTSKG
jgi:hypothetical protein